MRAVILATGGNPDQDRARDRWNAPLTPLLDRPFIQHVVEYIVARGITELDIVLCHHAARYEKLLGDGQRWGCSCRYHLARDPDQPCVRFRSMAFDTAEEWILFADAERLPQLDALQPPATAVHCQPIVWQKNPNKAPEEQQDSWTGWAWVRASDLREIPAETRAHDLGERLLSLSDSGVDSARLAVDCCLDVSRG